MREECDKVMFFQSCKAFRILDIYKVKREYKENKKGVTDGRSWAAVAFRISGSSQFESGGKLFCADEGSVLYIPSGVPFSREGSAEELIILHLECYSDENEIEVLIPKNISYAKQSFSDLYEEWASKKDGYEYRTTAMLYTMLDKLRNQRKDGLPPYKSAMIAPGIDMINSEFDTPSLTVSRLARACNMSEEYFRMLYKAEYGVSPRKAITDKRIEKAARLLEAGYFSISKVAEECGFENVKYFSTLFHTRFGMSPREYKQTNG